VFVTKGKQNLKITRVIKNNEDGSLEATMKLTPDQVAWLINLALLVMIERGTVMFQDLNEKGESVEFNENQAVALEILES
jgi:hypothetical protein